MASVTDRLLAIDDATLARTRRENKLLKLDSGLSLELPPPRVTAQALGPLLGDVELFRKGSALLTRPKGSEARPTPQNLEELAERLRRLVASAPGRPFSDGRALHDLRVFSIESDSAPAYFLRVVRALRDSAPTWHEPRVAPERGPRKDPKQSLAEHRARVRRREVASTVEWLTEYYLGEGDAEPGDLVDASKVYESAVEELTGWRRDGELLTVDGVDGLALIPGKKTFYAVADGVLGPRRRTNGRTVYTIPETCQGAPET